MCGRDEVIRDANEADSGTGEPFTRQQPRIWDRCPSCGSRTLFIGSGGWLTCSVIGCRQPAVGAEIQALKDKAVELVREIARLNTTFQMVDGVLRPVPWDGSGATEAVRTSHLQLLLGLERLRSAGETVVCGVPNNPTTWWPNFLDDLAQLERRCFEARELLTEPASVPELRLAIAAILATPYGCAFCDSGVLRKRVDKGEPFHADDCPWALAQALLSRTTPQAPHA